MHRCKAVLHGFLFKLLPTAAIADLNIDNWRANHKRRCPEDVVDGTCPHHRDVPIAFRSGRGIHPQIRFTKALDVLIGQLEVCLAALYVSIDAAKRTAEQMSINAVLFVYTIDPTKVLAVVLKTV